jgi:phytoene dehydrogenase-like protein
LSTHLLLKLNNNDSPRVEAGKHTLPGHKTPLQGLWLTGDFTFPGIGVPATAAAGAITANSLVSLPKHLAMLDRVRLPKRLDKKKQGQ